MRKRILATGEDDAVSFDRNWSLEVLPTQNSRFDLLRSLPVGSAVYVPSLPGSNPHQVVDACVALKTRGLTPVPHVVARGLANMSVLDNLLGRLRYDADVSSLMLLGGDVPVSRLGQFASSRDVLATGLLARHGFRRVGFATYPEPHPHVDRLLLEHELRAKLRLASEQGLEPWLVTQLCFDSTTIVRHAERIRSISIDAPIAVGLAGPCSWKGLARFAALCGVSASVRSLMRQGPTVGRLLHGYDPFFIVQTIKTVANGHPELRLVAPHFFTFGDPKRTIDWLLETTNARASVVQR